jgi:DNA repair exonuclease SbcCD ATPase subunit
MLVSTIRLGGSKVLNKHILHYLLLIILLIVLVGCQDDQEQIENIYTHLEETVLLEKKFEDVQQPLLNAEQEEQKLYEEIIKLPLEEFEKIQQLSSNATESAVSRQKLIEQESESIEEANKEFNLITQLLKEIKDQAVKEKGTILIEKMEERYQAYQQLYKEYKAGIEADLKLYELFRKEDLSITELENHINDLNEHYNNILTAQNEFNEKTESYNTSKKEFYKASGLEVDFE